MEWIILSNTTRTIALDFDQLNSDNELGFRTTRSTGGCQSEDAATPVEDATPDELLPGIMGLREPFSSRVSANGVHGSQTLSNF
jgi:hypothetical protein